MKMKFLKKYNIAIAPAGALTTGGFPDDLTLHPTDIIKNKDKKKIVKDNLPNFYLDEERINRVKEHAQSFSYEKHVNAYLKLYEELLQSF